MLAPALRLSGRCPSSKPLLKPAAPALVGAIGVLAVQVLLIWGYLLPTATVKSTDPDRSYAGLPAFSSIAGTACRFDRYDQRCSSTCGTCHWSRSYPRAGLSTSLAVGIKATANTGSETNRWSN